MERKNITLEEKIDIIQKLAERKKYITAFINSCQHYLIEIKADYSVIPLKGEDKKLGEYVENYYKKELEKVDKRLNGLLK